VAEELIFGSEKVTTGAANDIQQATTLARRMVTQFGMSEAVGVIAVGDREQEIFLGREIAQRREISEQMSEIVDREIKRLIDEAYARARGILTENRPLLDQIAEALLDRETLDREEMDLLNRGEPLPPAPPPRHPVASVSPKTSVPSPVRGGGLLGAPPAEPAGA
jgi:cell division protease FtsH